MPLCLARFSVSVRDCSPAASKFELGSSKTTETGCQTARAPERSAVFARRTAALRHARARSRSHWRLTNHVVNAGALRRVIDVRSQGRRRASGRCFVEYCRGTVRPLAADTDVFAELAAVPMAKLGAVQAHLAGGRYQASHQHARQRRLARSRGTNDRKGFARLQRKRQAIQNRLLGARREV